MFNNSKILKASFIVLLALVASTDVMGKSSHKFKKTTESCPNGLKECWYQGVGICEHAIATEVFVLKNTKALFKNCDACKKTIKQTESKKGNFFISSLSGSPDSFCVDKDGAIVQKNGEDVSNASTKDSDNTETKKNTEEKTNNTKERW